MSGARVVLALLVAASLCATAGASAATRIGVAPFANRPADAEVDLAALLARELERLSAAQVVDPSAMDLRTTPAARPRARDVRQWATSRDLDDVVVGWREGQGRQAVVELRSGHSGAPRADYRLAPAEDRSPEQVVRTLARLILADLGEAPAERLPPVAAAAPGAESVGSVPTSGPLPGGESDDPLAILPGAQNDEPIAINSDELEVLPQGGGRKLVFSRNVEVQQGDITLEADRLEAIYPEGASQPDRLHATGHVRVAQGDRRGRCEEATYERLANTIVCRGKAQVTQGCDEVRGESIEFDLGRKRVRVVGAASVLIQPDEAKCATPEGSQ